MAKQLEQSTARVKRIRVKLSNGEPLLMNQTKSSFHASLTQGSIDQVHLVQEGKSGQAKDCNRDIMRQCDSSTVA